MDLTTGDCAAFALASFICAGLFKLLTLMIKDKIEDKKNNPCKAFENDTCPLKKDFNQIRTQVNEIYVRIKKNPS